MKYDGTQWVEVKKNAEFQVEERLRLQVDREVALYTREGDQTLVCGVGSSFDLKFAGVREFWLSDPEAVSAIYLPRQLHYRSTGVRMTNADRQIRESGAVAEVTRALRLLKYERRQFQEDLAKAERLRRRFETENIDPETGEVRGKAAAEDQAAPAGDAAGADQDKAKA